MFGVEVGAAERSPGFGVSLPETSRSVTLHSSDGAGFGFDICGDAGGAIAVQSLQSGGPAQQSGLIQPGDQISAVNIDMAGMSVDDARKLLDSLAQYPISFNVRKSPTPSPTAMMPGFGVTGSLEGPDFSLPSDGSAGGTVQKPDINGTVDVNLPGVGISEKTPESKTDLPSAHIGFPDVSAPAVSGSVTGPRVDMPGIEASLKEKGAEDNIAAGGVSGSINGPQLDVSGSVEGPSVGISGNVERPQADVAVNGLVNGPGIDLSTDVDVPQREVTVKAPQAKIDSSADASVPDADVDVHVKGSSLGDRFKGLLEEVERRRNLKWTDK